MDVLQRRRRRPDDHDLVLEDARRHFPVVDAGVGVRRDGAARAGVVDPLHVATHLFACDRPADRDLGRDDREGFQLFDRVAKPAFDAVLVSREVRAPRAHAELVQRVLEEEIRPTVVRDLGGRDGGVTAVADECIAQRVVSGRRTELAELNVESDHLRLALANLIKRLRVEFSVEWPAPFLVIAERRVVDLDDDDVLGRRLVAAQREAEVDRLPLEVVEEAEVEHVRGRGRDDRAQGDEQEEPGA